MSQVVAVGDGCDLMTVQGYAREEMGSAVWASARVVTVLVVTLRLAREPVPEVWMSLLARSLKNPTSRTNCCSRFKTILASEARSSSDVMKKSRGKCIPTFHRLLCSEASNPRVCHCVTNAPIPQCIGLVVY